MPQPKYNLHLKGFVGGYDFDRDYVDYILAKNAGKPVNVLIDSTGGSLATALSISSAFKLHGDVSVHFVGMNASAATIAALGAKHVSIDTAAWYLVHKCSNEFFKWSSLNADQMADLISALERQKADLDKLDAGVAAMYAAKCCKDPKALLDLMKVGGWLSAKEALEWGFVDEITDEPEDTAPKLTDSTASAMAAAGMPIPNVPVADRESGLGRFFAAIAAMFRPSNTATPVINNQSNTPQMSTIIFPALCAALALDSLELSGDKATASLSVEQLAKNRQGSERQRLRNQGQRHRNRHPQSPCCRTRKDTGGNHLRHRQHFAAARKARIPYGRFQRIGQTRPRDLRPTAVSSMPQILPL